MKNNKMKEIHILVTGVGRRVELLQSFAIVADLHEFEPKPVLSRLSEIRPDVIAVPGDLFENHEFGENLDKEDDSLISRLLCRIELNEYSILCYLQDVFAVEHIDL